MTDAPYRMVRADGTHEMVIKKSRFICHLFRVTTESEARARIDDVRKLHWDASHNCSAWIIGAGQSSQRSNDDGEPSGTAGVPMLEVLRKRSLTDTLAVVTRYFGGVLLGASGLIRAYSSAVSEGLDTVGIVERVPLAVVHITADYETAGRLENAIRTREMPLVDVIYGVGVTFELEMPPHEVPGFQQWVRETTNGATGATIEGERFVEVPVGV